MVSAHASTKHTSRLVYIFISLAAKYVSNFLSWSALALSNEPGSHDGRVLQYAKRDSDSFDPHKPEDIAFAVLIPALVLLSGLFAGLTLGYMSLDETQLNVLSISGTEKQREYARKILPIRENGHLLLVTLLLANMIVNESLPIIADPVLGGGVQSIVVSTVLIVIFSEIIPQSLFTRYGLYLGAKMAWFTRILIYALGIVSWPVAKVLEYVLGPHHGIIYRRAELKELIAMHSTHGAYGGDLKTDTVTIIGATLDLQEKVVRQAMTPIQDVFMLSIESKLDYKLLRKICLTGHSRVPVYEEVDVPIPGISTLDLDEAVAGGRGRSRSQTVKKIVGILLVKQCVLLDPNDATPLWKIPLNKVPFVPENEPLLGILDKFQEGRSHIAIVSRFSREKATSVKHAVKRGLTQRLRDRVGMGESDSSDEDDKASSKKKGRQRRRRVGDIEEEDGEATLEEGGDVKDKESARQHAHRWSHRGKSRKEGRRKIQNDDNELAQSNGSSSSSPEGEIDEAVQLPPREGTKSRRASFQLARAAAEMTSMSMLEQSMPADAVLAKEGAKEFLQGFDPAVHPLGIITLEDVLEELIGEEIYDEFDVQGAHGDPYVPPAQAQAQDIGKITNSPPPATAVNSSGGPPVTKSPTTTPILKPLSLKGFDLLRSRSAPPTPRDTTETHVKAGPSLRHNPARNPGQTDSAVSILGIHSQTDLGSKDKPSLNVDSEDEPSESNFLHSGVHNDDNRTVTTLESDASILPSLPSSGLVVPPPTNSQKTHITSPPMSRSVSPAPSFEAILLDRKRRTGAAGTVGAVPSIPSAMSGSSVPLPSTSAVIGGMGLRRVGSIKGTRFKSSPLGGVERAGVVVAERIKETTGRQELDGGATMRNGEHKIPDEPEEEVVPIKTFHETPSVVANIE